MHRRNIAFFGPTTLRATVCYNLLRLAKPKPGEIIIDPMCGGGSIPIEATKEFPLNYIIGGDNHEKAMERSRMNFAMLPTAYKSDLIQWNLEHLPFKDSSALQAATDLFKVKKTLSISMGGLNAAAYVLKRTNLAYDSFLTRVTTLVTPKARSSSSSSDKSE
ncbi:Similar to Thumpd3: THUMP domain-containing protein 3 (Mus musculus) [Cotesia congregata]|uniref:Similar to Thumpd3: THUMP domain-containing protein 3 (Mus musculus) n=1 Tax=Cotesia congregata TaxID=51543 RepID=A0A8J2HFM4_COTCN|nr:Similar to Thumpd3: THUMP domain-containing protein 3 (Mus musculus) [Cotesia congregata]